MPGLTAPDGTALVYDAYEPPPAGSRAAVLILHGWSDHAGRYAWLGERLQDAGLAAYALDQRGHGRSGGLRAHLSRFSQLLGDLQAFRREVGKRRDLPQVLLGHSFGGLVVLRYLETQPSAQPAAAVVSGPFLGLPYEVAGWKLVLNRVLADLWPTAQMPIAIDHEHLSRDPACNAAYVADPAVHGVMTPGAWREIRWAQRAVVTDAGRIECAAQFLLAGEDRIVDTHLARAFAGGLKSPSDVRWYPEMYHEVFNDPQREQVVGDVLGFLGQWGIA
ncbi:MAG: lysophospholipase [Gemmatimonadetes bacterium]|nr:lysophospholipase [Gemmatimonadota bacterium]